MAVMRTLTAKRILRYINRFGLQPGLQAARLHWESKSLVQIRLPGLRHPLWSRPGTSDVETFEEVFLQRQYEPPFDNFAPSHIIDLGANIGFASVYFASRWPNAQILAIEPAHGNIELLKKNVLPWGNIKVIQAA